MARHADVAVVGGGIIGLTAAYFLARAGLAVEVLDRSDLGREASWAGVELRAGEPVRQLSGDGITLESDERVEAGRYLLAAGAWSERLLAPFGVRPGVHPVRGQIVLLNPGRPVIRRVLMLGKEYLVP